jgi:hypothetical protein
MKRKSKPNIQIYKRNEQKGTRKGKEKDDDYS